MRLLSAAVGMAVLAAMGLASCSSSPPTVSKNQLQTDITDQLTNKGGHAPQAVDCKNDLVGQAGKTATCDVTENPTNSYQVIATVTNVDGKVVKWDYKPALSKDQLQNTVSQKLQQGGTPVNGVNCDSALEGKVGAVAHCSVESRGATMLTTVEVTNVQGALMDYHVIPWLPKASVENALLDQLQQQLGQRPESAACTGDLEGKVGAHDDCVVTAGSETQDFTITVANVNGTNIDFNFEPKH